MLCVLLSFLNFAIGNSIKLSILEIVKAGQQLLEKDSNIKMAKVEGPENPGLLKRMNVTGYPTLFYYRNADDATLRTEEMYQPIKYEGNLDLIILI